MALTLQEYASYLDKRSDLSWPAVPEIELARAKPSLTRLAGVRAVTWNIYGTLLALWGGQLYLEHPQKLMMDIALDKTIQEFKMWASMSRKPGQPADYLRQIYANILLEQQSVPVAGEKFPEISADRIWNAFIKKLFRKDYQFDALSMGSLNEFSRKVAYFFHASMQGTACYPGRSRGLATRESAGLGPRHPGKHAMFFVDSARARLGKTGPEGPSQQAYRRQPPCLLARTSQSIAVGTDFSAYTGEREQ